MCSKKNQNIIKKMKEHFFKNAKVFVSKINIMMRIIIGYTFKTVKAICIVCIILFSLGVKYAKKVCKFTRDIIIKLYTLLLERTKLLYKATYNKYGMLKKILLYIYKVYIREHVITFINNLQACVKIFVLKYKEFKKNTQKHRYYIFLQERYRIFCLWLSGEKKYNMSQTEFLPVALEVLETPPSRTVRAFWLILVIMFSITILYISFAKTDVVITARAKSVPKSRPIIMQSLFSGIVKNILVEEGQKITKGTPLVVLENTITNLRNSVSELKEKANLVEVSGYSFLYEKAFPEAKKLTYDDSTIQLANSIEIMFQENVLKLKEEENILAVEHRTLESRRDFLLKNQIPSLKRSFDIAQKKFDLGIVGREALDKKFLELNNALMQVTSIKNNLNIVELKRSIKLKEIKSINLNFGIKMKTYYLKYKKLSMALGGVKKIDGEYIVVSNVEGYVGNISVNLHSNIKQGDQLLEVIKNDTYIIEGEVLNKDIGLLKLNQEVFFKVDSYPYTKFGMVKGKLAYIAGNSHENKNGSFLNKIKINIVEKNEKIRLQSGMTGTVDIKLKKRTLLEYLISPISKAVDESMREL